MFELVFVDPEGKLNLFIDRALFNDFCVLVEIADEFIVGNMNAYVALQYAERMAKENA